MYADLTRVGGRTVVYEEAKLTHSSAVTNVLPDHACALGYPMAETVEL